MPDTPMPITHLKNAKHDGPARILVLISGTGSNLQALLDAEAREQLGGRILAVFSNRDDAAGLARAAAASKPTQVIRHADYANRDDFDGALMQAMDQYAPDLVVLAGFMRILTPAFVNHYQGRLINIHPSLLPKYPGLNTHRQALENGDSFHGATVHFVSPEVDGGPAILQARVAIHEGDTADSLAQTVLAREHCLLPLAVRWFCEGRLRHTPQGAELDRELLIAPVDGSHFQPL